MNRSLGPTQKVEAGGRSGLKRMSQKRKNIKIEKGGERKKNRASINYFWIWLTSRDGVTSGTQAQDFPSCHLKFWGF